MPFITEEIWQMIGERKDGESLMISRMSSIKKFNRELVAGFEPIKETITALRSARLENRSRQGTLSSLSSAEKTTLIRSFSRSG
jgi:valyl-tRNA synthetase